MGKPTGAATRGGSSVHRTRISAFASGYASIFREAFEHQRVRVLAVIALSAAGAVLQGASLAVLRYFIDRMSAPATVDLRFTTLELGENPLTVSLLAVSVLVLMVGTAAATYGAARQARAVARSLHRRTMRRVIASLETFGGAAQKPAFSRDALVLVAVRSARILGRSLQITLQAVPTAAQLLMALAVALYLDARLTLALVPLAAILAPILYLFSGSVQRTSKAFYDNGLRDSARRVRALVESADSSRLRNVSSDATALYDADPQIARYLDLYDGQLLAVRRSVFITSIFRAISIFGLLILAGYAALRGSFSWGELAAYVGALSYLLNNLQGLVGVFTQLNRFYPHVQNFAAWRDNIEARSTTATVERESVGEFEVRVPGDASAGADQSFVAKPGSPLAYWTPRGLGRLGFWDALDPLIAAGSLPKEAFVHAPFIGEGPLLGARPLVERIFGAAPTASDRARLAEWTRRLGLGDEVDKLGSAAPLDEAGIATASEELRAAIRLLPLAAVAAPLVLFSGSVLAGTRQDFRLAMLEILDDRLVIAVSRGPDLHVPAVAAVIVSDGDRIVGAGSPEWFAEGSMLRELRGTIDPSLQDDEEDDDDDV